jgi:hypothetical protein
MLEKNGFGDEKSAAIFVQKYNASVFYDDSLSLKENAGKRQARSYIFVRTFLFDGESRQPYELIHN